MIELNCILLNTGHSFKRTSLASYPEIVRYRKLVQSGGGSEFSDLGHCEFKIIQGAGHVVIGMKVDGRGAALAVLATAAFGSEFAWDELYQQHAQMMLRLGQVVTLGISPPSPAPWLGISLAPSVIDSSSLSATDQIVTILTGIAFALLP